MITVEGTSYVTADEAVDQLGPDITAALVRDWARRGLVTPVRVGQRAWYPLDQLWDAEHRTRTAGRGRPRRRVA